MIEINLRDIPVLRSDKDAWRSFIIEQIRLVGLQPRLIPFNGLFGEGLNILVDIPLLPDHATRLLGAHYDGRELHDNIGGVLGLLHLVQFVAAHGTKHAWRIAFWDSEERFQQGSRAYIKTMRREACGGDNKSVPKFRCHSVYVDIDGLGIGSTLFAREITQTARCFAESKPQDHEFFLDCESFASCGLPSYHVFSGTQRFETEYSKAGLDGCLQIMLSENLATEQNWQCAMPVSLAHLERLVVAWESVPFRRACALTGLTWLRKH